MNPRVGRITLSYVALVLIASCGLNASRLVAQNPSNGTARKPSTWIESLPAELRDSILWYADYETGNLDQWSMPRYQYSGGGVLNTDEDAVTARATRVVAHSGQHAAEATIRNAIRAANGKKAVRLMRWATDAYDRGGVDLPLEAYYSTWMYLSEAYDPTKHAPWDPGDGGWWNVFQFKSHDENDESQSTWSLNIDKDQTNGQLSFYLYSPINRQKSWEQQTPQPIAIPIQCWFHVEAFVKASATNRGEIAVWFNGEPILQAKKVKTSVNRRRENIVWGIGNYTDHISGGETLGTATIYFDDSLITTRPVAPFVKQSFNKDLSQNVFAPSAPPSGERAGVRGSSSIGIGAK